MSDAAFIHQFRLGPWDNFIYFIGDKKTRTCAVVDPAWHAPSIFSEAERLGVRITHILCTHSHLDHTNRVGEILEKTDAQVHMLAPEIAFSGFRCSNLVASHGGDEITIGDKTKVSMLHTPGHTPGSVCYRVEGALVTGDTLFVDGCGRCDFVGGDPVVMHKTLHDLVERLPGDTVMYPGHDYGKSKTATLNEQLQSNPYLKLPTLNDFVAHRMQGKTPGTPTMTPPSWTPG